MKEPVDHILRVPLPWRSASDLTECGLEAINGQTITREVFIQRVKDLGQQRAAMLTCMTCAQTAGRHGTWADDPRQAMSREIEWEGNGRWAHRDRGQLLKDELLAIAELIEAHREEFDASIKETEGRREWLTRKAAMEKKPKATAPRSIL